MDIARSGLIDSTMTHTKIDNFKFLQSLWPVLYELGVRAEGAATTDPDIAAVRLRSFTERMVECLFDHFGLQIDADEHQFDRLLVLERGEILDRRLLAKLHTIRKFGNRGAHGGEVTTDQAEDLVVDAWSLGCWFARLLRPDVNWIIRPYGQGNTALPEEVEVEPATLIEESADSEFKSNVFKFPEERIRRIRNEVAHALSQVDPRVRQLRTRMTMLEAFAEELNSDQEGCATALEDFLTDKSKRIFLLKGNAGSGKTFMAKGLIEYLSTQGRAYRIAAPTGRAAKVIGEKTGREACTLHSLIYNYGNLHEYDEDEAPDGSELATFKVYANVANNRESANAVYVIDEASLVSDDYSESDFFRSGSGYLLRDLMKYIGFDDTENDRKIIFIGDPAQLTPVGMSTSPALDPAYLREHFGQYPSEYRLTEVVRQHSDSGILANVRQLRKGVEEGVFRGLEFDFTSDVERLTFDELLPTYMKIVRSDIAGLPIVITRSNAEAAQFNKAVHSQLFPGSETVHEGDRLIITSNTIVGSCFLANGEFVDVVSVEPVVERRSVRLRRRVGDSGEIETIDVDLIFRDIELALPSENDERLVQSVKVLDTLLHDGQASLSTEAQRALYVDFQKRHPALRGADRRVVTAAIRQDPYFNAVRAKFGYAVTCHKAQGGEWENVFVVCPAGGDPRNEDYFRWLYTAMTRSSSRLFLINPPEVRIKIAGPSVRDIAKEPSIAEPIAKQSPFSNFKSALLHEVRELLDGSEILIDDVAHYQYQEAFYCSRDKVACRVNFSYNRRFQIRSVTISPEGELADEIRSRIASLVGRSPISRGESQGSGSQAPSVASSRPFVRQFDERLRDLLRARDIDVASMEEKQWNLRYVASREHSTATIDIYFDGKERFTKCIPVGSPSFVHGDSDKLLGDLVEVITTEIVV